MKTTFKAGCSVAEINQTVNVTGFPDSSTNITKFDLSSLLGEYFEFGSFTVDSPNSGTYGIG